MPLAGLGVKPGWELYLGLVHMTGGIASTRRRIAAAEKVVRNFGIATECGFGRRPADSIPDLFRQHVEAAGVWGRRSEGHAASRPPTFLCFKGIGDRMSARSRAGGDDRLKALKEIFERRR